MSYYVSRQFYHYSGTAVVEVTTGGADYAGADMLSVKYGSLGEGQEYGDPREAVEAAIEVCRAWRNAGVKDAKIAFGATGGMGIEIEPCSFADARDAADVLYAKLPKCSHCSEVLGKNRYRGDDWSGDVQCSEYCAEKVAEWNASEECTE